MSPRDDRGNVSPAWPVWAGLSITPVVTAVASLVAPTIWIGDVAADMIAFAGAAVTAIFGIALAASGEASRRLRIVLGMAATTTLMAFALAGVRSSAAVVTVDAALVAAAWAIGVSIGKNIQHPGHLFPACVVVACVDLTSILSRFGPTRAIAASDRALSVVAVSFPVPGTPAFAPALGAGDLVFVAMLLGAARAHRLPLVRATVLSLMGAFAAAAASAVLGTAVPALVPIGAAVVLGLPAVRTLRREDRRVAIVAMAIAASLAAATIASRLATPHFL